MNCTIEQAKNEIKNGVRAYLAKDENGKYYMSAEQQLPFYLMGPAGVGKTEVVGQCAKDLGIGFASCSMVHHTRQSAIGLPEIVSVETGNEGETVKATKYTESEIIAMVHKKVAEGHKEGILLLDEYNCVSETLMPASLAFLQNKHFGNSKLPEGWVIVLCGNPPKSIYNKQAREFDAAIMDRLRFLDITTDTESFMKYLTTNSAHNMVRFFLKLKPQYAYVCDKDKKELVTHRTWENLSNSLKMYEKLGIDVTKNMIYQFIKSDSIADYFYNLYTSGSSLDADKLERYYNGIVDNNMSETLLSEFNALNIQVQFYVLEMFYNRFHEVAENVFGDFKKMAMKNLETNSEEISERPEKGLDKGDSDEETVDKEEISDVERYAMITTRRDGLSNKVYNFITFLKDTMDSEMMYWFFMECIGNDEAMAYVMDRD